MGLRRSESAMGFFVWVTLRCRLCARFSHVFGIVLWEVSSFWAVFSNSLKITRFNQACYWRDHRLPKLDHLVILKVCWSANPHRWSTKPIFLTNNLRRILEFLRWKIIVLIEFIHFMVLPVIYGLIVFNEIGSLLSKLHFHLLLVLFEIQKIALFIIIRIYTLW